MTNNMNNIPIPSSIKLLIALFILVLCFAKVRQALRTGSTKGDWGPHAIRLEFARSASPFAFWIVVLVEMVGVVIGAWWVLKVLFSLAADS
jgi:hypothetical protein